MGELESQADWAAIPGQICQSTKNKHAGAYDLCRQKAEAKYATTADGAARTQALQKCLDQYNLKWPPPRRRRSKGAARARPRAISGDPGLTLRR
jgi:hypothetical protein